jgi:TRAP-type C4-dicarboxylate transport system substrate-binding protein
MSDKKLRNCLKWFTGGVVAFASLAIPAAPAAAPPASPAPEVTLRIVGGLATGNRYAKLERPFWVTELAKLSGGKFKAEIVPFDRAGVPGQEMLRMMQLGVIPFGTALSSNMAAEAPEINAPDLAGLNPDIQSVRKTVAAFRPYLQKTLRERYGVEVLGVYLYPPQVIFCKRAFASLADLSGRRVRVASTTQWDFVEALGALPVRTEFAGIMASMANGNTECAITAAMAGNTLGLHQVTTHIHTMPTTWGLSVFAANSAVWTTLNPELKALLKRELPRLEQSIWDESERDSIEGIACNTGAEGCVNGRKGNMIAVSGGAADERRRQHIFADKVLPKWLQRCGAPCTQVWNQTVRAVVNIEAPVSN